MTSIRGTFFAGDRADRIPASLRLVGNEFRLSSVERREWSAVPVSITQPLGSIPQRITFDDGSAFEPDEPFPPAFLPPGTGHKMMETVHRLEGRTRWFVGLTIACLFLTFLVFRYGLNAAAVGMAWMTPLPVEEFLGETTLTQLDDGLFRPSTKPEALQQELESIAVELAEVNDVRHTINLHLRDSPALGANALALAGGTIVVTDDLIDLLSREELVAVIAHELGHIDNQDVLRRIYRIIGFSLMLQVVIGADITGLEEITGLGVAIGAAQYSQSAESRADAWAVAGLTKFGADPGDLADALTALEALCAPDCEGGGWLSSHPDIYERIDAITQGVP